MSAVLQIKRMVEGYTTIYGKPPLYLYVGRGVSGKLRNELNIPDDAELDTLFGLKLVHIGEVAVGREMICYATAVD